MNEGELRGWAADLSAADLANDVPFASLTEDLDRVLWLMRISDRDFGAGVLSPHEIAVGLRDALRYDISRQRVEAILARANGLVAKRRRGGKRCYQIMQEGISRIEHAKVGVLFIDPAQALSRVRQVQDLLSGVTGVVRICDPYLAPRSLDFLVEMTRATEIRVLTYNIDKENTLRRDLKPLGIQLGTPVEIRSAQQKILHDRYVIDDTVMLILGTSLNGMGLKQTMVVAVGEDLRSIALKSFDSVWATASPL